MAEAKMITLLEDYVEELRSYDHGSGDDTPPSRHSYHMPEDSVTPDEWADFDNVYQIHCPKVSWNYVEGIQDLDSTCLQIFMNNTIRDVSI
jgi:hypothetical protein